MAKRKRPLSKAELSRALAAKKAAKTKRDRKREQERKAKKRSEAAKKGWETRRKNTKNIPRNKPKNIPRNKPKNIPRNKPKNIPRNKKEQALLKEVKQLRQEGKEHRERLEKALSEAKKLAEQIEADRIRRENEDQEFVEEVLPEVVFTQEPGFRIISEHRLAHYIKTRVRVKPSNHLQVKVYGYIRQRLTEYIDDDRPLPDWDEIQDYAESEGLDFHDVFSEMMSPEV